MYEYLFGDLILGIIWLLAFILRRDLRKPIIWSSIAYPAISAVIFIILTILSMLLHIEPIVPGYWNPNTLLDLGRLTGGYGIEDALFMFFAGGIATFVYEFFFRKKIKLKKTYKHHIRALFIGIIAMGIFTIIFKANLIYSLTVFYFAGAISICIERRDLIYHSLFGGLSFLIIYFSIFLLFNMIFPSFIQNFYNLQNISGILFFGVPFEELLYAVSFGLIWSPIYEYEHGEKDIDA